MRDILQLPLFAALRTPVVAEPAELEYTLVRSRRRSIAIHVHDGRVEVKAPLRAAKRDIDAFVVEKTPWILRKLEELQSRSMEHLCVASGSQIVVMGDALHVQWRAAVRAAVVREGGVLWIEGRALDARKAEKLFLRWLADLARASLLPVAEKRIEQMSLSHKLSGFTLRYTRSLWGRCSGRGNILFNPLILLAPVPVMEYLVVHEACHLQHMNHSLAFWALVAEHCEHWQQSRRWLKEHGHRLRVG